MWSEEEEAEKLRARFANLNRAEFARQYRIPGGAAMIYQHITGRRPIGLEAAQAYARGFGVPLEEISPRLAAEARSALDISDTMPPANDMIGAWHLLTREQREAFVDAIRKQADTNKAILEQLSPPKNVEHVTVSVSERRLKNINKLPFADRRKKNVTQ